MSAPHVVVVGGGLAGLTAAIDCVDAGARVSLFESRPRLGGATWSSRVRGLEVDNGQHVFLRCCEAYRGLLRRLRVEDRVTLQSRLEIAVLRPGGARAWLRRAALPSPAHLAPSLLRYAHLSLGERLRVARTAQRLGRLDPGDPRLDRRRLGEWLAAQGEGPGAIDRFWELLVRPTLNLPARDASLALAAMVFQTGLLSRADAADVGWATLPLARVHAEPAEALLRTAGARVFARSPIDGIEVEPGSAAVRVGGERVAADAVILATPHDAAAELLPPAAGVDPEALRALGTAPIVNLHVVFDRAVLDLPFAACVDSPLEWIFDRSRAAGVDEGQYLAVSLSAADAWVGRSRAELQRVFLPAFEAVLPAARSARVVDFFATCERAATFRQAPGTAPRRPGVATRCERLFLAGAWTATGWPATMEGAVRSGNAAARAALRSAGVSTPLSEAA